MTRSGQRQHVLAEARSSVARAANIVLRETRYIIRAHRPW